MSDAAAQGPRSNRWARPGGFHDYLVGFLKFVLPALVGVLLAYLALAPLSKGPEVSFLLDKNKVETAKEHMSTQQAQYRGQDKTGRPFLISAQSAVQARSDDPIVDINGMAAQIGLDSGPARIVGQRARYDMSAQTVAVAGPIRVTAADGYQLDTHDVTVNLNDRTLQSRGRVEGSMPLGRFTAGKMNADLGSRTVVLSGGVRMRIHQGAMR